MPVIPNQNKYLHHIEKVASPIQLKHHIKDTEKVPVLNDTQLCKTVGLGMECCAQHGSLSLYLLTDPAALAVCGLGLCVSVSVCVAQSQRQG
jgi:hypothetical protein